MAIDRSTQPIVKDASGVLVGVAQVRIGNPSIRAAGAVGAANFGTSLTSVGTSKREVTSTNSNVVRVATGNMDSATVTSVAAKVSGVTIATKYSGKVDGMYIFRAAGDTAVTAEVPAASQATHLEIYGPYGYRTSVSLTAGGVALSTQQLTLDGSNSAGTTVSATFTGLTIGDTFVLPVWSDSAMNISQTGIITPFSMFTNAAGSIGGLKSAQFQPKIDGIKTLESGFPSYRADQIIDKVSVEMQWSGYEYTNTNLAKLKDMIARVINTGELSAISVEMVMRTRGGSLVRMWNPSANFASLPTYAPTNDFSDIAFSMSALKQTEFSTAPTCLDVSYLNANSGSLLAKYNAWLSDTVLYSELTY